MSVISTHVLDIALGKPAAEVGVRLERQNGRDWETVALSKTDVDGRCRDLTPDAARGVYRLTFLTAQYLEAQGRTGTFYDVPVQFVCDGNAHYHVPLLLSDNGYTVYRGS